MQAEKAITAFLTKFGNSSANYTSAAREIAMLDTQVADVSLYYRHYKTLDSAGFAFKILYSVLDPVDTLSSERKICSIYT